MVIPHVLMIRTTPSSGEDLPPGLDLAEHPRRMAAVAPVRLEAAVTVQAAAPARIMKVTRAGLGLVIARSQELGQGHSSDPAISRNSAAMARSVPGVRPSPVTRPVTAALTASLSS